MLIADRPRKLKWPQHHEQHARQNVYKCQKLVLIETDIHRSRGGVTSREALRKFENENAMCGCRKPYESEKPHGSPDKAFELLRRTHEAIYDKILVGVSS